MKRQSHSNNRINIDRKKKRYWSSDMMIKVFALIGLAMLPFSKIYSNGLTISGLTSNQSAQTVTFDLTWSNGWRNSSTIAKNWDAAWIFVKFRDCTASSIVPFTHGLISTTISDHTFAGATTLEPTQRDGTVGIDASPDNTGIMLRSATNPFSGTVSATVTLKITNLPTSGSLDLRVFGLEMVFIPQATYMLGDGNGTSISTNAFAASAGSLISSGITSENAQNVYERTTLICPSGTCALTATFPKGYNPFYVMKYEISEEDYVSFLNTTSTTVQWAHYFSTTSNRYAIITSTSTPYASTRPDRACNFLSWADVGSYLDWAAIRPLTELEFEKACRGTGAPVPFEVACGSITIVAAVTISGTENGTETITTANANICAGSNTFSGGDAGAGPLRGGIFATSATTTRQQTGGSFYGVMELSGNVAEYYISALSGTSGPSTSGVSLGDGVLTTSTTSTEHFNTPTWPTVATSGNYIIRRGGDWSSSITLSGSTLGVSNRAGSNTATRDAQSGGRGGR